MRRHFARLVLSACALGASLACGSPAKEASCPQGWMSCKGTCVDLATDPDNCGSCGRACSVANALPACSGGASTVDTCLSGWGDCDDTPANGCETNLRDDLQNCGECANVCALANATDLCVDAHCAIAACATGFADCDHSAVNGCETATATDPANCGACGTVCPAPDAGTASCAASTCQ